MKQSRGVFLLTERANHLQLLCRDPKLPGQSITEVLQDSARREFYIRSRGLFPFTEHFQTIPFATIFEISLTVYRTETAGEHLPLLLCLRYYKNKEQSAQVELQAFMEGVDCLQRARELLFRIARFTATPSIEAGAFRTHDSGLEFGFYTEHQVHQEFRVYYKSKRDLIPDVWEPEQLAEIELKLHRSEVANSLQVPDSRSEAPVSSFVYEQKSEPPPTFGAMLSSNFKTSSSFERLKLILFCWAEFAATFYDWIVARVRYNARHVNVGFAFWGVVRLIVGFALVGFVVGGLLFMGSTEHLSRSFVLLSPFVYLLSHHLRKRHAQQRWPSPIADQAEQKELILSYTVLLIASVSWALVFIRNVFWL